MTLTQRICWFAVAASAMIFVMGCTDNSHPTNTTGSLNDSPNTDNNGVNGLTTGNTGTNRNMNQSKPGGTGVGTAGGM